MNYDREEAGRVQDAEHDLIGMRDPAHALPRPKALRQRRSLTLDLLPRVRRDLDELAHYGAWGASPEEVAEVFIMAGIQRLLERKVLVLDEADRPKFPKDPK